MRQFQNATDANFLLTKYAVKLFLTFQVLAVIFMQIIIVPYVAVDGIKPDLVLILVVFISLRRGWFQGAMVGLASGLFIDLGTTMPLGTSALSKMLVAVFVGLIESKIFKEHRFTRIALCFIASLIDASIMLLLLKAADLVSISAGMAGNAIISAVDTAFTAGIVGLFHRYRMPLFLSREWKT